MTKEEVLEKVKFHAELKGLTKNTQDEYYTKAKMLQDFYDKPATELDVEDIQKYLHYLYTVRKNSSGTINTYISGIKFLYNFVLDMPINSNKIPRHKKRHKIPDILTRDEVQLLLNSCNNLRDKAILMTMYSSGLRLSEVTNLKVCDIDSENMQLFIKNGKGNKDRYAILSQTNLECLREYWKQYRPEEWLFYSRNKTGKHITERAAQDVFKSAKINSGITKNISSHTLRHSFATHLLENGTNIFYIKQLLGHASISSTCVYLHLVKLSELNVKSPLDTMQAGDSDA